jgi:hypothetical protein
MHKLKRAEKFINKIESVLKAAHITAFVFQVMWIVYGGKPNLESQKH